MVGACNPVGGARRDVGFSMFYTGINLGAFLAPLVTGWLGERVDWHWGFGAAGIGMLFGLITFRLRAPNTLGPIGLKPNCTPEEQRRDRAISFGRLGVIAGVVLLPVPGVLRHKAIPVAQHLTASILR